MGRVFYSEEVKTRWENVWNNGTMENGTIQRVLIDCLCFS